MSNAIELENVVVRYGPKKALDGLSLTVRRGEIFGFLGPNGAGKSTTLKALLGLVRTESGKLLLDGIPVSDPKSRRRIGYLPEETHYYRFLNASEAVDFYAQTFGLPRRIRRERIPSLLSLVGLADVGKKPLSAFSKGMMQKLSLAQALVNDPDILILDEPTTGLDPISRLDLRRLLYDMKKRGKTVFFSSHELSEVELLCDSVAIVKSGRLVKSGTLAEVVGDAEGQSLERFFVETIRSAS